MEKIWKRIEAWLEENAPDVLADLRPGTSAADIEKAERALSCELPADMADSYRIHDGQRGAVGRLFGKWELMQLAHAVKSWKTLKKVADEGTFDAAGEASPPSAVAPQIKHLWWNPKWIPVASNSSGDFLCVDLDPARGGKSGQVISYLHTDAKRELVAKDFKSWLGGFAKDLEAGKYKAEGDHLTKTE
jgi:cell wall assembly regulator SMI1